MSVSPTENVVPDLTIDRHQKLVGPIIRMHAELGVRREHERPDAQAYAARSA